MCKKVVMVVVVAAAAIGATFFGLRRRPASPDAAPPPGVDHEPACIGDRGCAVGKAEALAKLADRAAPGLYFDARALSAALARGDCEGATELAGGVERADVDRGHSAALAKAADAALLGREGFCSTAKRRALTAPPPDASVTLVRGACEGNCPVYEVTVRADGEVSFVGRGHVASMGTKLSRISPPRARELFDALERLSFSKLNAEYKSGISDAATATVSVTTGGRTQTASDDAACFGTESITTGLCYLERRIDEIARTERNVAPPKP